MFDNAVYTMNELVSINQGLLFACDEFVAHYVFIE